MGVPFNTHCFDNATGGCGAYGGGCIAVIQCVNKDPLSATTAAAAATTATHPAGGAGDGSSGVTMEPPVGGGAGSSVRGGSGGRTSKHGGKKVGLDRPSSPHIGQGESTGKAAQISQSTHHPSCTTQGTQATDTRTHSDLPGHSGIRPSVTHFTKQDVAALKVYAASLGAAIARGMMGDRERAHRAYEAAVFAEEVSKRGREREGEGEREREREKEREREGEREGEREEDEGGGEEDEFTCCVCCTRQR